VLGGLLGDAATNPVYSSNVASNIKITYDLKIAAIKMFYLLAGNVNNWPESSFYYERIERSKSSASWRRYLGHAVYLSSQNYQHQ